MFHLQILIFLATISFAISLHIKEHHTLSSNLQILQNKEQTIVSLINSLSQNSESINKKIFQSQNSQSKIALLEEYLLQQRKLLLNLISASAIDLNNTNYQCPIITQAVKNELSYLNQKFNNSLTSLSSLNSSVFTENNLNSTFSEIKDILPYLSPNILPIYSKSKQIYQSSYKSNNLSNINIGYYILGNTTQKNQLSTGISYEICSYDLPFLDKLGQCITCPSDKPYFLVDNFSCVYCQFYDEENRKCTTALGNKVVGVPYFTNFAAGKSQLLLTDSQSLQSYTTNQQNLQQCPAEKPFFNGNQCISCSNKLLFSLKDKNCQTCSSGKFYNVLTLKCQIQLYFSNLNKLEWQTKAQQVDDILESITIKRSNESYTSCPLELPFSVDTKCIKCENGTHFLYDNLSCAECPKGTKLDMNMHKCLKPGNTNFQTNPLNTSNLIYNGRSKNEWMNIYYQNLQQYNGISDCPQGLPNFDGLACISCPHSHPYFNLELMVCQACQGTTLYSQDQRQCINDDDNRPVQTPSWEKMAAAVFSK